MTLIFTKLLVTIFTLIVFISTTGSFFKNRYKDNKLIVSLSILIAVISTFTTVHFVIDKAKEEIIEEQDGLTKQREELAKERAKKEKEALAKERVIVGKRQQKEKLVNFRNIHFIDNKDGTVTDKKNNLMWKKCSEGQNGSNCENGTFKKYTWQQALNLGKQHTFAGYSNWRLPTLKELLTLVECSNGTPVKISSAMVRNGCSEKSKFSTPTINIQSFPKTISYLYWTSDPFEFWGFNRVWLVHFGSGSGRSTTSLDALESVRLVRDS